VYHNQQYQYWQQLQSTLNSYKNSQNNSIPIASSNSNSNSNSLINSSTNSPPISSTGSAIPTGVESGVGGGVAGGVVDIVSGSTATGTVTGGDGGSSSSKSPLKARMVAGSNPSSSASFSIPIQPRDSNSAASAFSSSAFSSHGLHSAPSSQRTSLSGPAEDKGQLEQMKVSLGQFNLFKPTVPIQQPPQSQSLGQQHQNTTAGTKSSSTESISSSSSSSSSIPPIVEDHRRSLFLAALAQKIGAAAPPPKPAVSEPAEIEHRTLKRATLKRSRRRPTQHTLTTAEGKMMAAASIAVGTFTIVGDQTGERGPGIVEEGTEGQQEDKFNSPTNLDTNLNDILQVNSGSSSLSSYASYASATVTVLGDSDNHQNTEFNTASFAQQPQLQHEQQQQQQELSYLSSSVSSSSVPSSSSPSSSARLSQNVPNVKVSPQPSSSFSYQPSSSSSSSSSSVSSPPGSPRSPRSPGSKKSSRSSKSHKQKHQDQSDPLATPSSPSSPRQKFSFSPAPLALSPETTGIIPSSYSPSSSQQAFSPPSSLSSSSSVSSVSSSSSSSASNVFEEVDGDNRDLIRGRSSSQSGNRTDERRDLSPTSKPQTHMHMATHMAHLQLMQQMHSKSSFPPVPAVPPPIPATATATATASAARRSLPPVPIKPESGMSPLLNSVSPTGQQLQPLTGFGSVSASASAYNPAIELPQSNSQSPPLLSISSSSQTNPPPTHPSPSQSPPKSQRQSLFYIQQQQSTQQQQQQPQASPQQQQQQQQQAPSPQQSPPIVGINPINNAVQDELMAKLQRKRDVAEGKTAPNLSIVTSGGIGSSSNASGSTSPVRAGVCGTCGCKNFQQNPFSFGKKKGCNNCFHDH